MSFRTRTPSIFRPKKPIDQSVLTQNRALIDDINRRGVLRGAISLGALTLLTGCDVSEEEPVQKALRAVSAWNDRVQAAIFRPNHLAPTFRAGAGGQAAAVQRLLRHRGRQAGRRRHLEAGIGRTHRRQAAVDRAAALRAARAGNHHPAHLRGRLGLHRPMVRPELEGLLAAHRRGSDGEVRLLPLRRRFHREHRHGDGAAPADHPRHQICRRHPSRIRSAIPYGCAPRPSSATRTPSGSRRSR